MSPNRSPDTDTSDPDTPYHISFVCSGNICRSPYAEGLLRRIADEEDWGDAIRVSSAGTLGIHDAPAASTTIAIAVERGINLLAHRSQGVSASYVKSCDVILGLAPGHVETLREYFPDHADRIFLLRSYPNADLDGGPVADPVNCEEEVFREVHAEIELALTPLLEELRRRFGPDDSVRDREDGNGPSPA